MSFESYKLYFYVFQLINNTIPFCISIYFVKLFYKHRTDSFLQKRFIDLLIICNFGNIIYHTSYFGKNIALTFYYNQQKLLYKKHNKKKTFSS